jgi:large subunit ribosomal protein L9
MKLLLCKNVDHLGIVGDVVVVSPGYARNYLLPYGLATEPTQANMRRLAEARKQAELERIRQREVLESVAARLKDAEVTIHARANEDGVLYGSVGKKEIAAALMAEGFPIKPEHVVLDPPIRHLDNVSVDIRLAADLRTPVKVWVVREKSAEEEGEEEAAPVSAEVEAGREAADDDGADN